MNHKHQPPENIYPRGTEDNEHVVIKVDFVKRRRISTEMGSVPVLQAVGCEFMPSDGTNEIPLSDQPGFDTWRGDKDPASSKD